MLSMEPMSELTFHSATLETCTKERKRRGKDAESGYTVEISLTVTSRPCVGEKTSDAERLVIVAEKCSREREKREVLAGDVEGLAGVVEELAGDVEDLEGVVEGLAGLRAVQLVLTRVKISRREW